MAILFGEEKRGLNWMLIIGIGIAIIIVIAVVYFLFFAPTPAFEVIAPPPLRTAEQITRTQVDPENVVNSQAFKNLRNYAPLPSVGQLGRNNPFLAP